MHFVFEVRTNLGQANHYIYCIVELRTNVGQEKHYCDTILNSNNISLNVNNTILYINTAILNIGDTILDTHNGSFHAGNTQNQPKSLPKKKAAYGYVVLTTVMD